MTAQAAQVKQPTLLGRAARMLLVFLLVFGMSFRVEMALAADLPTSDLKSYKVDEDTLTDLAVCKVDTEKNEVLVEKGKVRSLSDMVDDKNKDGLTLEFGKSVTLAAAPKWKADGDDKAEFEAAAAKYVEWQVGEEKSTKPTVKIENDGTHGDSVTVTCAVSADAKDYLSKKLTEAKATKVSFTIKMAPEPEPEATTKAIPDPKCVLVGEGLEEGASDLKLTLEQGASYKFIAKVSGDVNAYDSKKEVVSTESFTYSSDSGKSLSEASEGLLKDLKWELFDKDKNALDPNVASIEQDGSMSVKQDSSFTVQCTVTTGDEQVAVPFQVAVTCGNPGGASGEPDNPDEPEEKKADQGADNPQSSLYVHGYIATSAMAAGVNAADEEASSSSAAEGESASSSSSDSSGAENDEVTELDKTFSTADIEALGSSQADFTVKSEAAGEITVTGEGPTLEALFKSMGIENLEGVNELKFVNVEKEEVTVGWSALSGAILAVKSYVHDPESSGGQENEASLPSESESASETASESTSETSGNENTGANEGATAEAKTELLENTRFRVLSNNLASAGIDADSLRWVNEIVVNPGKEPTPVTPEEPDPEAPFSVSVAYAPSPIGQEAVFWPVPSKEIAGATFDYTWEESADKVNWEKVSENPTYRTITTEERVGHWFRVILSSDMVDEATGKKLRATSDPVEMIEGWGISLVYDPPLAGNVATFNVKFTGFPSSFKYESLEYVWELSTDGCETWQKLASQYQGKSTLSIQTDPIDEKDSDGGDVTPVYIRCRVVGEALKPVTDTTAEVAGPQMLTVRTGEEAGDGDDKKSSAPEGAKPVNTVIDQPGQQQASGGDKATTDDEDDLEFIDDSDFGDDDGDDDDTRAPSEGGAEADGATAAPQLHINGEVTEKILEQEKAVQEQIEQTVPGARWTAINTTEASGDDVRNVLADNPFAPFAIPVGLGITVAGGLEKLLAFRRQL